MVANSESGIAPPPLSTQHSAVGTYSSSPIPHTSVLSQIGVILWKDLLTEFRRRETLISLVVFSLLVLVVFDFAFDLGVADAQAVAPGILWVTFVFAGVLGLNRAFAVERDKGTLDGLILAPVDRGAIYIAKLAANIIFMLVVEAISLAIFAAFFNVGMDVGQLALVIVLGTIGFSSVGTLFAAMSASTRAREILLPVLLFPIAVPVLIGAVKATGAALGSGQAAGDHPWLGLIAAFDAIFLAVSFAVFEYVLEE